MLSGTALLVAATGLFYRRDRLLSPRPLFWTLAVLLALGALGTARFRQQQALPPAHIGHLVENLADEPEVVLEGRVDDAPRRSRHSTRFVLATHRLFPPYDTTRGRSIPVAGSVEVALRPSAWDTPKRPFPPVEEGDLLRLRGRLRAPPRQRNPAGFDYGTYLRRHGIYATMSVYEPTRIAVTGRRRGWLERLVVPARHHVKRQFARYVPSREARAVLHALLLGDRSLLDGATEEHFARSGLMHLLAVSGLHVLLVGWLFYQILRPPLLRTGLSWRTVEMLRATLALGVLAFYVVLAGAPASATRAVTMAALLMGATLVQRPTHSLNALGAAAVLLLLWRPAQLFGAGFQLSFAAVAAIVVLSPVLERVLPLSWEGRPLRRWIARSTFTTLAATLGTLPVLLAHFGRVPFAGLLLNLWAIPLTAATLLGGLAVVSLGGWAAPLAGAAGAAADLTVQMLLWTARTGNAYGSWSALRVPEAGPWLLAASVGGLLVLTAWPRPRLRWRLLVLTLAVATVGCWHTVLQKRNAAGLDVLFFDVGHGDATLLALPDGGHVLIDAGGRSSASDAGRRTLLPHLEHYGIDRIDTVLLSHPDGDHLGGLPTLLRSVEIGRFITSGDTATTALFDETRHLLDSLHVPVRIVRAGDTLRLGMEVSGHVLGPTNHLVEQASENDASLVVRLQYGGTRFLFTGDVEAGTEALLTESYGAFLSSEVIKVAHHSSETSSTPAFVRTAGTEGAYAVASSGHRFGLPSRRVLKRWREAGARPLATADEGAIWLRSDGARIWRVHWR